MAACKLRIRPGANVWLLARTNDDSPTPEDVIETTAAYLVRTLGPASPLRTRSPFETVQSAGVDPSTPGVRRFYIGAARPVEMTISQRPVTGLPGTVYATRADCPESWLGAVEGTHPWYIVVEFDWRASATVIPWPRTRSTWLELVGDEGPVFHWLLLEARHVSDEPQHTDSSLLGDVVSSTSRWWDESVAAVKKELDKAHVRIGMALAAGVAVGVLFLAARSKR